jgi:hypothetical protein
MYMVDLGIVGHVYYGEGVIKDDALGWVGSPVRQKNGTGNTVGFRIGFKVQYS